MTGGSETNPDGAPMRPPGPQDRPWTHPSEIGLATRGSWDRRRSSLIATGVVLGGLGLLLSGVLLGSGEAEPRATATSSPHDRIDRSIATLISVEDGETTVHTALVIDHEGHLLVTAEAAGDADSLWVRTPGGTSVRAERVATDRRHGLGVLQADVPRGTPAQVSDSPPEQGQPVLLVHSTVDETVARAGRIGSEVLVGELPPSPWTHHVVATPAVATGSDPAPRGTEPDELVFDDSGRLLGLAEPREGGRGEGPSHPRLRPAREVLARADRLIEDAG